MSVLRRAYWIAILLAGIGLVSLVLGILGALDGDGWWFPYAGTALGSMLLLLATGLVLYGLRADSIDKLRKNRAVLASLNAEGAIRTPVTGGVWEESWQFSPIPTSTSSLRSTSSNEGTDIEFPLNETKQF